MFLHRHNPKCPQKSILIFAGVLFSDQLLKNIFLSSGEFQKNHNALFGIEMNYFYALAILFIFIFLISRERKNKNYQRNYEMALALIFSGIVSNFIDKIRFGFIIDYVNFINIFIFNLADIAILLGAIFFIWQIIKE